MTPSAQIAGGRRVRRWSRETIITKIREWNDRYGEPPCSADWNPSLARWRAQEWRIERYRDGFWPSTNAAKRPFGGSFDAAVRAAGLEPHRPGPRRRAAGEARPDFVQRAPQEPRAIGDALVDAEARAVLERKLRAAERRTERAEQAARDARRRARRASEREGRARRARDRVQVAERRVRELTSERVEELVADGEARVRAAVDQAEAAAREVTDARRAQQRADARAAEAEARAELAERLAAAARAALASDDDSGRAPAARNGALSDDDSGHAPAARNGASSDDDSGRAPAAGDGSSSHDDRARAPGNAARRAPGRAARRAGHGAAWKAARDAEERAAAAERRARELAVLVCGQARRLSQAELDALRAGGPSGPAVLAAALKGLARARAGGNGPALDAALTELASAAIRWRDRL
jgi:hypothetical protein